MLSLVVDRAIEGICNIWRKKTYSEVCGGKPGVEWTQTIISMTTTHIAMNRSLIDTSSVYF